MVIPHKFDSIKNLEIYLIYHYQITGDKMNRFFKILVFVLPLIFCGKATASQEYNIEIYFTSHYNGYSMKLYPPKGYVPNSKCMSVWNQPEETTIINNFDNHQLNLKDKNSGSCINDEKYVTWEYELFINNDQNNIVSKGKFQLYHNKQSGSWKTKVDTFGNKNISADCGPDINNNTTCDDTFVSNPVNYVKIEVFKE